MFTLKTIKQKSRKEGKYIYFLQILVGEDISTRTPGTYDNQGNSILICKSFHCVKVDLPVLFRKKIKTAYFKMAMTRASFIEWVARSRKQNIGTRTGDDC